MVLYEHCDEGSIILQYIQLEIVYVTLENSKSNRRIQNNMIYENHTRRQSKKRSEVK
jgi:hypothetical protein